VNGGACAPHAPPSLPRSLKYGETLGDFVYFCEPMEASVSTDRGVFTFRWTGASRGAAAAAHSALPGEPTRHAMMAAKQRFAAEFAAQVGVAPPLRPPDAADPIR
jgi:hypothetical protein